MKVCVMTKQFGTSGGSERYAVELVNGLGRRDHSIDVFTLAGDNQPTQMHENVSVHPVASRRRALINFETLYYSLLARRQIDFSNYDIIHGTLMPASSIALSVRPPQVPLVLTSHGTSLGEVRSHRPEIAVDYLKSYVFHPLNVVFDMLSIRRSQRVIAISEDAARELKARYPIAPERVVQISHGVDTTRFTPEISAHSAPDEDRFSCLMVGRLVSRKHVSLGIEAVARADPSIELLIAGTGPHRARLERLAARLDVTDRVRFLGFVPDEELPSLYASCDVFLFLSRYEGFGLTFLEAMASGLPVIGTPVGGFPDVVKKGRGGSIIDRDPEVVSKAIERMVKNREHRRQLGKAARVTAQRFSWDDTVREVEELYEDVLSPE